ncbi:MAG: NTP transferase domain-containing protein [Trueperaceae bacterium]|nr:NTP transferase domain-containing protein [Trueperaceae bacterium]
MIAGASVAVILAAGQGTRMRSERPKVVHEVAGRAMVGHVVRAAHGAGVGDVVVVVGAGEADVRAALAHEDVRFVRQAQPRGTGDALAAARDAVADAVEAGAATFVLNGDGPLVRPETLDDLARVHAGGAAPGAGVTVATAFPSDPSGLGRIVRDADGGVARIVEEADADAATRAVRETNAGTYVLGPDVWPRLAALGADNAQGEVYLTDLAAASVADGAPVRAAPLADPDDAAAANDRRDLARLEAIAQARLARRWMTAGVTFRAPGTTFLHDDVALAPDVVLEPGVVLERGTRVGAGAHVGAGAYLAGCTVAPGARVAPHTVATDATLPA